MRQRPGVLDHLGKISDIDEPAADGQLRANNSESQRNLEAATLL
jgi:hypothetical protein